MDSKYVVQQNQSRCLTMALKSFGKTKEDLENSIITIKGWLHDQIHLPEITDDSIITSFILINKFCIETTKQKLDMYYTIRMLLPEIFHNKNPSSTHMQSIADTTYVVPLPKTTIDGYCVVIMSITSSDPDMFNFYNFIAHTYNIGEVRIHESVPIGDILIYDLDKFTINHLIKITPVMLKKSTIVLEKVYSNRIKQIHFMNCPPFVDKLVSLIKGVLKPKLANRIHVHKQFETLGDYLPLDILPIEFGGQEISLKELNDLWKKKLEEYQNRFDVLEKMRVNEELRPLPLKNDDVLGFHGNFRKLNVD